MRRVLPLISICSLLALAIPVFGQGFVASSLEQYNYQVGDNQLVLKSYDGFDEISDFPDVTGLTLSINGGTAENIPFDSFYGTYKRGKNYNTLAEMLAERPIDATYTHTLSGTPSASVSITAPNVAYADAIPEHPVFTISGVTGTWGRGPTGIGRFFFDPATVTSFNVTMNAYNVTTGGGHHVYAAYVADVTSGFNYIDEYSSDIVADEGASPTQITLTFTKGLPLNGGDEIPTTFGFTDGTRFEIEGEHVNVFGLGETSIGDGSMQAFPYQSVTAFNIEAIADPASVMPTATSLAVTDQAIGAQDGVNDRFFLDWEANPTDAAVDVYRSTDLSNWIKVSALNQASSYSEPISGAKAFYTVVPTGQTP